MIAIGNTEISAAYVGSNVVDKIYCGNNIVYEKLLYDTEVEYIQSDGYACIDLDVQGNNTNLSYELLYYPLEFGTWSYILGNYVDENSNVTRMAIASSTSHNINFNFNKKSNGGTKLAQNVIYTDTLYRIKLSSSGLVVNSGTTTGLTANGTANSTNVAMFNAYKTTNPQNYSKARLYWMRIWDGNTLLKDFIPVSINGVGALFDKISREVHYNLGGNDILVGSNFPTSYDAEVEYLQSDGSSYIDTEICGNNDNLEFYLEYSISTHVNYGGLFGNYISETANCCRCILSGTSGGMYLGMNTSPNNGVTTVSAPLNAKNTLTLNKNKVTINGVDTQISNVGKGTTNNLPITLFIASVFNPAFGRDIGLKVYKFQIRESGTLIRDFIPVRVGTVGYMYDNVGGKIYRNRGYGSFVYGSDV